MQWPAGGRRSQKPHRQLRLPLLPPPSSDDADGTSDSDDEDEDYAPSETLRHLCHSSEHSIVAFSKEGTREHGDIPRPLSSTSRPTLLR